METTAIDYEKAAMYGICLVCHSHRDFKVTETEDGMLATIVCAADESHLR